MRVSRSTVESLIINLVMVKEEDKGRGFMTVYGTIVFFSSGILLDYSGNTVISRETRDGTKKSLFEVFSKFFNIIVHKLPS